jgi:hypothetical protein
MVFMAVGCNTTNNAIFSFKQPSEIWNYHVDVIAVFGFRKHQTAINQQYLLVLLYSHAISADFAEPTKKRDANWFRHLVQTLGNDR